MSSDNSSGNDSDYLNSKLATRREQEGLRSKKPPTPSHVNEGENGSFLGQVMVIVDRTPGIILRGKRNQRHGQEKNTSINVVRFRNMTLYELWWHPQRCRVRRTWGILGAHFDPRPSELYSRYTFQRRDQLSGESINHYVAALKQLASDWNFGILAPTTTPPESTIALPPAIRQRDTKLP